MTESRKLISITDDDPAVLDSIQLVLERAGYATQLQASSMELLRDQRRVPALYIIDKQLNGVDGLEACRVLKRQTATSHIPVIVVSASPYAERLAAVAGADAFLEKPYRSADLLAVIRRCLSGNG